MRRTDKTLSALVWSLCLEHGGRPPFKDTTTFAQAQLGRIPDYLRFGLRLMLWVFDWSALLIKGLTFHNLPPEHRARVIQVWRGGVGPMKDLILFFESLVALDLYSRGFSDPTRKEVPAHVSESRQPSPTL